MFDCQCLRHLGLSCCTLFFISDWYDLVMYVCAWIVGWMAGGRDGHLNGQLCMYTCMYVLARGLFDLL